MYKGLTAVVHIFGAQKNTRPDVTSKAMRYDAFSITVHDAEIVNCAQQGRKMAKLNISCLIKIINSTLLFNSNVR